MNLMNLISDLGDSAVLLPLSALTTWLLWRYQGRYSAIAFLRSAVFCTVLMVILKLVFIACGREWAFGVSSPSGHASMSTVVYGALLIAATRQAPRWQQVLVGIVGTGLIAGIALSRAVLRVHSPMEVLLGMLIGLIALLLFPLWYLRRETPKLDLIVLVVGVGTILFLAYGTRLPIEQLIHTVAVRTRSDVGICPGG